MKQLEFEKLVEEALLVLPQHIQKEIDNLAIVVEPRPSEDEMKKVGTKIKGSLLGLYQGVPKTTWGRNFGMRLPDKITIFQEAIENLASSSQEIKELIKITLWHEIAHHFGFNEKRVRALERKWREKN